MVCKKSACSFLILMLFSSILACDCVTVSGMGDTPWVPFKNPNSLAVVAMGIYALHEHNKRARTHLKFENVIGGASQESNYGDSLSYRLVVSAKNGNTLHKYKAIVQMQPKKHLRSLTSFTQVGGSMLDMST